MRGQANPARGIAQLIVRISMVAAGLATIFSLFGNSRWILVICGGTIVLNIIVLLVGAYIVASSKRTE